MNKLISLGVLAAAFASPAFAQGAIEPLSILSGGKTHAFQVEVAVSAEARAKALGGRAALPKDHGMLIDFRSSKGPAVLDMKGVSMDLDMLFLESDGTVLAIASNARAGSLRPVAPGLGAAAVLEIAGGQASALGLKPGDKVRSKTLGNGG
jgi:uncharacterized membrane protein (UPF0127 family)